MWAASGTLPVVEAMEGIRSPVDPHLHQVLRRAVLDFARSERRRVHLPLVHVGTPGGHETVFADRPDEPGDHALRADVLAAMVRRTTSRGGSAPLVWLTRPGDLELQDVDLGWLASARTAYAEARRELTMVVVNRHGWRDPRTGVGRHWVRLRHQPIGSSADPAG